MSQRIIAHSGAQPEYTGWYPLRKKIMAWVFPIGRYRSARHVSILKSQHPHKIRVAGHASNPSPEKWDRSFTRERWPASLTKSVSWRHLASTSGFYTHTTHMHSHTHIFTCTYTYSPLAEMTLIPVISSPSTIFITGPSLVLNPNSLLHQGKQGLGKLRKLLPRG